MNNCCPNCGSGQFETLSACPYCGTKNPKYVPKEQPKKNDSFLTTNQNSTNKPKEPENTAAFICAILGLFTGFGFILGIIALILVRKPDSKYKAATVIIAISEIVINVVVFLAIIISATTFRPY